MVVNVDQSLLQKTLGRHTRLAVRFSWNVSGSLVDLQADGFTVQAWVLKQDGTTLNGPTTLTIDGTDAIYLIDATDLDIASADQDEVVQIVARADNTDTTLISDARSIVVGEWGGAGP